ncbi:hypothetical protein B0H13DRAFT_1646557 [Mycena leptocephala]|nr:hypothetical protein B0H13DRAFT_1646557 [Mycena leptocephala]
MEAPSTPAITTPIPARASQDAPASAAPTQETPETTHGRVALAPLSRATLASLPAPPQPSASVAVHLPPDAPRWLQGSIQQLQTQDLGCHFTALLAALVTLETKFGFDDEIAGTLPNDHRPSQIKTWIQGGRSRTKRLPPIRDLEAYIKEWRAWWDFLQPQWRTRDRNGEWAYGGDVQYGQDDEWGHLDALGPNGCLSVVAALYFWGVDAGQTTETKVRWINAVLDVTWVLEGLANSMKK